MNTQVFTSIGRAVKKHCPEILMGMGIAGMMTTTILAVAATPKAMKLIEAKKREQQTEKLRPIETVKTAWHCYLPSAVTMIASVGCLIGAETLNAQKGAALAAAYALSETARKEYGNKVTDWTPAPEDAAADLKALSDNVEVLVGYRVEIVSTSDILSDDIPQTTLRARVWHGSQDVTDSIPASRFRWTRVTSDSTADTLWNNNHKGVKSITLGKADVLYSATYNCELEEAT